jgi:DNA polymerase III sliding clamp (beta) subunit (PCNA family)
MIRADVKTLLKVVKLLSSADPRTGMVTLETVESGLRLTADGAECRVRATVPAEVPLLDWPVVGVNLGIFIQTITSIPGELLELQHTTAQKLEVTCGRFKSELQLLESTSITPWGPLPDLRYEIDTLLLRDAIARVKHATESESLTYRNIELEFGPRVRAAATDSLRIATCTIASGGNGSTQKAALSPIVRGVLEQILKHGQQTASIDVRDNALYLCAGNFECAAQLPVSQLPDIDRVLREPEGLPVLFNAANLLAALKRAGLIDSPRQSTELRATQDHCELIVTGERGSSRETLEAQTLGGSLSGRYRIDQLTEAIETVRGTAAIFNVGKGRLIIRELGNPNYTALVGPTTGGVHA